VRAPIRKSTLVAAAAVAAFAPEAWAMPPAPCAGTQIIDPRGDGHHTNTDVTAAWLTESAGRLQAVVAVDNGLWAPAHPDSESAGVALLYEIAGQTRYARVTTFPAALPAYDHGTWAGGFVSAGATTGAVTSGAGGTVTLDLPAQPAGTVLARPFVLTFDGAEGGGPHWVDRAPGGIAPDEPAVGADFVVGSCTAPPTGGPGPLTAVALSAPARRTGSGSVTVSGRVTPARAGVAVTVTAAARTTTTRTATTGADGSFSLVLRLSETTQVRAVAEGRGSQTLTVALRSRVRIKVRKRRSGTVVVSGTTSPKLTGRILWLRAGAVRPSARATARNGRFTLRLEHPRRGRYQAVFIPTGNRAERSTSNTGVIR
jgi:hypothetical protein